MQVLMDVPAGLNGVAVAETEIGSVNGELGYYHYREHDAVALARRCGVEDVWFLLEEGHLPSVGERFDFAALLSEARVMPAELADVVRSVARVNGTPLAQLRTVLSAAAGPLRLKPLIDLASAERRVQARRLAAIVPVVVGDLHRAALGLKPVPVEPDLGHAASYLRAVTGADADPANVRALEQYLVLTIDHGFNASTFTARVAASTGADVADVVCAALGALAGPLHGGAPSRALDALDAIGSPERAPDWVHAEVAAGRRIMGFGHAVYRAPDPRSALLREVAIALGGELVERAVAVEAQILATLSELKPDRPLPSNVEFYAGVIMETIGLPRRMFTPTFAVSRVIGWTIHALEQAAAGKLIRPSARYVGPEPRIRSPLAPA